VFCVPYFVCFIRSIVRACLENLQSAASKTESSHKELCLELVAIFYNVEFLWHLCEILYVDVIPGNNAFNNTTNDSIISKQ
jgi:hypothetical protein